MKNTISKISLDLNFQFLDGNDFYHSFLDCESIVGSFFPYELTPSLNIVHHQSIEDEIAEL